MIHFKFVGIKDMHNIYYLGLSGERLLPFGLLVSFMDSFVFKQQVLFRVDFLSVTFDHRVQCPRMGLGVKI